MQLLELQTRDEACATNTVSAFVVLDVDALADNGMKKNNRNHEYQCHSPLACPSMSFRFLSIYLTQQVYTNDNKYIIDPPVIRFCRLDALSPNIVVRAPLSATTAAKSETFCLPCHSYERLPSLSSALACRRVTGRNRSSRDTCDQTPDRTRFDSPFPFLAKQNPR